MFQSIRRSIVGGVRRLRGGPRSISRSSDRSRIKPSNLYLQAPNSCLPPAPHGACGPRPSLLRPHRRSAALSCSPARPSALLPASLFAPTNRRPARHSRVRPGRGRTLRACDGCKQRPCARFCATSAHLTRARCQVELLRRGAWAGVQVRGGTARRARRAVFMPVKASAASVSPWSSRDPFRRLFTRLKNF